MITITKSYTVSDGKLYPSLDLYLYKAGYLNKEPIAKSSASKVSEFNIEAHTFDQLNSLKVRVFSLNELEVELDINTKEIRAIVLRDTSVHKKLTFNGNGATLTSVRGKDVVGENSEFSDITTKEPIEKLLINNEEYLPPFELNSIYKRLIGESVSDISDSDMVNEQFNINLWKELQDKIEGIS